MRSFFSALVDLFSAPSFSSIAHASSADDFSGGLFSDDSGGPSGLVGTVGRRLLDEGINPATGLPMIGCVDVAGNPYGADLQAAPRSGLHDHAHHDDHSWHDVSPSVDHHLDDTFGSLYSSSGESLWSHDSFGSHDSCGGGFGSSWD